MPKDIEQVTLSEGDGLDAWEIARLKMDVEGGKVSRDYAEARLRRSGMTRDQIERLLRHEVHGQDRND
jgi:hypothetical protein